MMSAISIDFPVSGLIFLFQKESYSRGLASSLTPVHKDVGTLASFSLHPDGDAAAFAH
jgi:hypothetical protein